MAEVLLTHASALNLMPLCYLYLLYTVMPVHTNTHMHTHTHRTALRMSFSAQRCAIFNMTADRIH